MRSSAANPHFAETGLAESAFAATSYGLSGLFRFWTKHVTVNAAMPAEFFVACSEELAAAQRKETLVSRTAAG